MLDDKHIAAQRLTTRSLWCEAARSLALREEKIAPPGSGDVLVRALHSAISRGTERLVFEGRVPASEYERMRAPFQAGEFPFPVKYGYCSVGIVEAGPEPLLGRAVFALHPHQDFYVLPAGAVTPVPDGVPARRAALAANMETALNAVWDSGAGPGDRIAVVGCGLVGLLVAYICAAIPGTEVVATDPDPSRSTIVEQFGARLVAPDEIQGSADVVFHASATPAGLRAAIAAAGMEARIVEMSWYGEGDVAAPLGGSFHSRRLQLISSQVGQLPAARRSRWTYARRLAKALDLLRDARLDALITHDFPFETACAALPDFLRAGAPGLAAVLTYSNGA